MRKSGRQVIRHADSRNGTDRSDAVLFLNRELSWLGFNERVLAQARRPDFPLYERLRFLGIFSSNLDEFFMVRVAGLMQQYRGGVMETPADGMFPGEQLNAISERTHALVAEQYRLWREVVLPGLEENGIYFRRTSDLNAQETRNLRDIFLRTIFPALTPLAVDAGHPFPHLRNKSLNTAFFLRRELQAPDDNARYFAVVQVPGVLSRFVQLKSEDRTLYLLLGDVISAFAADIFPGYVSLEAAHFRVTRNWDLTLDEEDSEDLLDLVRQELRRRDKGAAVRLEINAAAGTDILNELVEALGLEERDVYRISGPLQIQDLFQFSELQPRPQLLLPPLTPVIPALFEECDSMFDVVGTRDVLLHHPYESFDPVVQLMREAAEDPNVLAIKQTLYRTSGDSPFIHALSRAAENGKQVTAFVEIKARFDEKNNIDWARQLEENGVHVAYGLVGLKTHCKVLMVVRREGNVIRRYVHLGTGNYNPNTARAYTDLSLFTTRQDIAEDVSALFNLLTGYSNPPQWRKLCVAPLDMQSRIIGLIERETRRAKEGQPARIIAKMNSLVDPLAIRALYAASQAGVEIQLLIRGICCLRPRVPGISENILVYSVVDRFLEHTRVFAFGAENPEVYLSSADWMPRNFVKRVEIAFPIEDPELRRRIMDEVLGTALCDNQSAWELQPDGQYIPVSNGAPPMRSQYHLADVIRGKASPPPLPDTRRFVARVPPPALAAAASGSKAQRQRKAPLRATTKSVVPKGKS